MGKKEATKIADAVFKIMAIKMLKDLRGIMGDLNKNLKR